MKKGKTKKIEYLSQEVHLGPVFCRNCRRIFTLP
jgi:hypothetical protein